MNIAQATPASLWLRLLAGVYDLLPLLGLWFTAAVLALLVTAGKLDTHRLADKLLVQALIVAAAAIYFIVSWLRGGQTIGMKPWRLRVVRADGAPLVMSRALIRFGVGIVSVAALGAGFWWALIDADKRAWHDIAAGTLVVRLHKTA
jgi:uncharacterized RDD family membrane protein YckC